MDALLSNIDYWHWWILAGILLIIEVSAPSFFFLWLTIAAAITGFVLLAMPDLGWEYQVTDILESLDRQHYRIPSLQAVQARRSPTSPP